MIKMLTTGGLSLVLLRAADLYFFHGRYTDAAMFMLREMRRSFGLWGRAHRPNDLDRRTNVGPVPNSCGGKKFQFGRAPHAR